MTGDDVLVEVIRVHQRLAAEIVAKLREHGIDAGLMAGEPRYGWDEDGDHEVAIGVPSGSLETARFVLAGDRKRAAELLVLIRRQLAVAVPLTAAIMVVHGFLAERWEWADLGTALWTFIAVVFLLGIAQRYVNRRNP